jgi:hypothetical protein
MEAEALWPNSSLSIYRTGRTNDCCRRIGPSSLRYLSTSCLLGMILSNIMCSVCMIVITLCSIYLKTTKLALFSLLGQIDQEL